MREEQLNVKRISQTFRYMPVQGDPLIEGPASSVVNSSRGYPLPSASATQHANTPPPAVKTPRGISIKAKWPAKPPAVTAKECTEWTKNIEVNHVSNGELKKFSNFPIILSESSATIFHVSQQLSCEVFAGKKVILLDNDNLPIPDTTASRGSKYWKTLKKIKAVTEEDYHLYRGDIPDYDDDDDDFEALPSFKKKKICIRSLSPIMLSSEDEEPCSSKAKGKRKQVSKSSSYKTLEERINKLENLHSTSKLASKCNKCEQISELFKCFICKSVVKSECLLLVCCNHLVCESCIRQWMAASRSCPLCRAENIEIENKLPLPRNVLDLIKILAEELPTSFNENVPIV
uniref:RING-type domain-containing protein n=1 Tax=Amphimedon queenslandica TaxID=400682 RepID=A0A1X7TUX2_AMPQE